MPEFPKDLKEIGFELFVGLVNPTEGLDASGLMTEYKEIQKMLDSSYGRKYIPTIFENNGHITDSIKRNITNEVAGEILAYATKTRNDALMGIRMRKQLANVEGDILIAPIPKDMEKTLKSQDALDAAILLARMATHELDHNTIRRLDPEDKDDIIADLESSKKRQERKAKRRERKSER